VLKVDLHIHTADDPQDIVPYTTKELIDRAAELGFDAIAITLHDRQLALGDLSEYARSRGIVVVPGLERTILGRHVLLINFPADAESVVTFEDVVRLKTEHPAGLVVAPHPFYPAGNCLRGLMNRHRDLFDAVEWNAFYTRAFNFNLLARAWARTNGKPMIANSDAHRLQIFGASWSLVDADPTPDAICAAIKAGRIERRTRPLSVLEAANYFGRLALTPARRGEGASVAGRKPGAPWPRKSAA
jgi:predicted metal-dependent phosphoesterase TrpH